MRIYPTPRLLIILALSVLVALGVGIYAPGLWAWAPLAAALLFVAALLDGMFAPVGAGLTFTLKPPAVLGVGRTVDVPFEARFTKWRQPGIIELRLGLHRLLLGSTYERRLAREQDAFHGILHLKAMARGVAISKPLMSAGRDFSVWSMSRRASRSISRLS